MCAPMENGLKRALLPSAAKAAEQELANDPESKSPAEEVGELAKEALAVPSISFEGSAPSRLAEEHRIAHAAAWRVTGNWLIVLLVVVITVLGGLEYRNPSSDLKLTAVVSGIVVLWVVSQFMRLVMIMGYGEVKIGVGTSPEDGETEDGETEDV